MKDDTISRAAALSVLNGLTEIYLNNLPPTIYKTDAVEAVTALPSAQPGCEDAVSRFEVLRLIDYSSHDLNDAVDNRYMQNEIKQLPSVTPKQPGWIPCNRELPKESGDYLVTIKYGEKQYAVDCLEYNAYGKEWNDGELFGWIVTAWQPAPKPWEGGQDG